MNWRLPQILLAMAALLLLGVASVWYFETRMGGATVPGLVLVDVPGADRALLDELAAPWPGARVEAVPAGQGLFAPFDDDLLAQLGRRGDSLVAYVEDGAGDLEALRAPTGPWTATLPALRPEDEQVVERCSAYVTQQTSTRAFGVGLALASLPADPAASLVEPLRRALAGLPEFRRSALVLLGARDAADPSRRLCLRLDLGPWLKRARPELADLLDAGW